MRRPLERPDVDALLRTFFESDEYRGSVLTRKRAGRLAPAVERALRRHIPDIFADESQQPRTTVIRQSHRKRAMNSDSNPELAPLTYGAAQRAALRLLPPELVTELPQYGRMVAFDFLVGAAALRGQLEAVHAIIHEEAAATQTAPALLLAQHVARQTQALFETESYPWTVLSPTDVLGWLQSGDPERTAFIEDLLVRLWSMLETLGERGAFDRARHHDGPVH